MKLGAGHWKESAIPCTSCPLPGIDNSWIINGNEAPDQAECSPGNVECSSGLHASQKEAYASME